jgi:hypothetical protein
LKVENSNRERPVTDVEVSVRSIEPYCEHVGPWPLKSKFSLASGAEIFIPLVAHGELHNESSTPRADPNARYLESDSFFELLVNPETPQAHNVPTPPRETTQCISIRATGMGSAVCDYRCKVWVDRSDGRLRIVDADRAPAPVSPRTDNQYIPLYEAAQRAYEETIETWGKFASKDQKGDPDGIIRWMCYALTPKVTIFGERPPSRLRETYSVNRHRNDFDLSVEGTAIVARSRYEEGWWTNLCVRSDELERAIKNMKDPKHGKVW